MWELDYKESWAPKNWCFWTVVLEKTPEGPWTTRRSNQSILKDISPEYSLEGSLLKLQYFGHLMQRSDSLEKTLMLGKIEGKRKRGCQRIRWLDGTTNSIDLSLSKLKTLSQTHSLGYVSLSSLVCSPSSIHALILFVYVSFLTFCWCISNGFLYNFVDWCSRDNIKSWCLTGVQGIFWLFADTFVSDWPHLKLHLKTKDNSGKKNLTWLGLF